MNFEEEFIKSRKVWDESFESVKNSPQNNAWDELFRSYICSADNIDSDKRFTRVVKEEIARLRSLGK